MPYSDLGSNYTHETGKTGTYRRRAYEKLTGETPSISLSRHTGSNFSQQSSDGSRDTASADLTDNTIYTEPQEHVEYTSKLWPPARVRPSAPRRPDLPLGFVYQSQPASNPAVERWLFDDKHPSNARMLTVSRNNPKLEQGTGHNSAHVLVGKCLEYKVGTVTDVSHDDSATASRTSQVTGLSADRFFVPRLSGLGRSTTTSQYETITTIPDEDSTSRYESESDDLAEDLARLETSSRYSSTNSTATPRPTSTQSVPVPNLPELEARTTGRRTLSRTSPSSSTSTVKASVYSVSIPNLPELEAMSIKSSGSPRTSKSTAISTKHSSYGANVRQQAAIADVHNGGQDVYSRRHTDAHRYSETSDTSSHGTSRTASYRAVNLRRSPPASTGSISANTSNRRVRVLDQHGSRLERRGNGEIRWRRAKKDGESTIRPTNVVVPDWYKWFTT